MKTSRIAAVVPVLASLVGCSMLSPGLLPVRPVDSGPFAAAVEASRGSVGKVSGQSCGGGTVVGTAFFVGDRLAVTAAHVVSGARRVEVRFDTGVINAEVIGRDPGEDTALLRLATAPKQTPLTLTAAPLNVGAEVVMLGYPIPQPELVITGARITAVNETARLDGQLLTNLITADAEVPVGTSGGPIIDAAGTVLAMANASMPGRGGRDSSATVTLAIPAGRLAAKIAAWRDNPALSCG